MNRPYKIVTIGGGNGHSTILGAIADTFIEHIDLSAIVSMSDDGRTTGRLMRYFHDELGIHFPPPGDVRRCLYFLSGSAFREEFEFFFEKVIYEDVPIHSRTLGEIARSVGAYQFLADLDFPYFDARLPIFGSLDGHKFGNIFMGFLFHAFQDNYDAMVNFMHQFLKVHSRVIPVTTDAAFIQARLDDGTIIERQDNISNQVDYTGRIVELSLMPGSESAQHNEQISQALDGAEYILIAPGDIYTSTVANLIIGDMATLIAQSQAKIVYIANTTNKGGEARGYMLEDFISEIEKYLGRPIDILIANNFHPNLSCDEEEKFKNDISVKGGEYIFVSNALRESLKERGVRVIEADLLDRKKLYKHDKKRIAKVLERMIFSQ